MNREVVESISDEFLVTVDRSLDQTVLEQYNQTLCTLTMTATNPLQSDADAPLKEHGGGSEISGM
jgi:hypothetical protein